MKSGIRRTRTSIGPLAHRRAKKLGVVRAKRSSELVVTAKGRYGRVSKTDIKLASLLSPYTLLGAGKPPRMRVKIIREGGTMTRPYRRAADSDPAAGSSDEVVRIQLRGFGIKPGKKVSSATAKAIAAKIMTAAADVFGSPEAARQFMQVNNFDSTDRSAIQLIEEGRSGRVLSRIDEMRSGFRG